MFFPQLSRVRERLARRGRPGKQASLLLAAFAIAGTLAVGARATTGATTTVSLGGASITPTDVNNNGWITGYGLTATGETHAFLYNTTNIYDLIAPGGHFSIGEKITPGGIVIGTSETLVDPITNIRLRLPFSYNSGALRTLWLGGGKSTRLGMNALGQVVGEALTQDINGNSVTHAWFDDGTQTIDVAKNGVFAFTAINPVTGQPFVDPVSGTPLIQDPITGTNLYVDPYSRATRVTLSSQTVTGEYQMYQQVKHHIDPDDDFPNGYDYYSLDPIMMGGRPVMRSFVYQSGVTHPITLGGAYSKILNANSSGIICGEADTALGERHAFVYDGVNPIIDLGVGLGNASRALLINESGMVVGTYDDAAGTHLFVYTNGSVTVPILPASIAGNFSVPTKLFDNGALIGRASVPGLNDTSSNFNTMNQNTRLCHAFLYSGGVFTDLGTPTGSVGYSEPFQMAADGTVIGDCRGTNGVVHGFSWKAGVGLKELYIDYTRESHCEMVNAGGTVVGRGAVEVPYGNDNHTFQYFVYAPSCSGTVTPLSLGGLRSLVYSLNDNNVLVGESSVSSVTGTDPVTGQTVIVDGNTTFGFVWDCGGVTPLPPTCGGTNSTAQFLTTQNLVIGWSTGGTTSCITNTPDNPPTPVKPLNDGDFYTATVGGWAGSGDPGKLLQRVYASTFQFGMTIGIDDGSGPAHHNKWDINGYSALCAYLTSASKGTNSALKLDALNPKATTAGNLACQVAACSIAIRVSGATNGTPAGYGNLVYHLKGDSMDGFTIKQIVGCANTALGTGKLPVGYSWDQLNTFMTNLTLGYDEGHLSAWMKKYFARS